MKRFNHLGSATLLLLATLLTILLVLQGLGVAMDWRPQTTPFRLVTNPFIGWCLVAVLAAGLALIRLGSRMQQCMSALLLVGLVFGLSIASGLFWDPWLSWMLVCAALPVLRNATSTLKALAR